MFTEREPEYFSTFDEACKRAKDFDGYYQMKYFNSEVLREIESHDFSEEPFKTWFKDFDTQEIISIVKE